MYPRNHVINQFKTILKLVDDELIQSYYKIIIDYLILEEEYQDEVDMANKRIYHHFKYNLPNPSKEYFEFLYHVYNPVRFAVETFDSIEPIRLHLNKNNT